ncbi:hypothetical protein [Oceanicoccus sagamiensis]|uniref:STAS domain-containing protein n=1 Tax=Oceanicoccus sagamiensis TaxID=716816 RepID=A0A1X9N3A5_9GAMM|nr:hypothetical protein [Oceanicoccus sagamiensis]ARN72688.1 hypothetical protein BST96_00300 [Oceanicoccus sagamiensis]
MKKVIYPHHLDISNILAFRRRYEAIEPTEKVILDFNAVKNVSPLSAGIYLNCIRHFEEGHVYLINSSAMVESNLQTMKIPYRRY